MYWELGNHEELGRGKWRAFRRGDWKYLSDDEGREYLFNMATDKQEKHNLIDDQRVVAARLRMRTQELGRQYAGPTAQ